MFCLAFLAPPPHAGAIDAEDVEIDGDDRMSVSIAVGRMLSTAGATFTAGGFGDDHWPVEVYPELSILIEQLPEILEALAAGEAVALDFYEQGIERTIHMAPDGDQVTLTCQSRVDWQPEPPVITASRTELLAMFDRLSIAIADATEALSPTLAALQPLSQWRGRPPH